MLANKIEKYFLRSIFFRTKIFEKLNENTDRVSVSYDTYSIHPETTDDLQLTQLLSDDAVMEFAESDRRLRSVHVHVQAPDTVVDKVRKLFNEIHFGTANHICISYFFVCSFATIRIFVNCLQLSAVCLRIVCSLFANCLQFVCELSATLRIYTLCNIWKLP